MTRRALALTVLAAWLGGVGAYARRERTRSSADHLAEVALRIIPGATFYAVERGGTPVGFASTTVDTLPGTLQLTDYLITDDTVAGQLQRVAVQTVTRLSRGLRLTGFEVRRLTGATRSGLHGAIDADSLLTVVRTGIDGHVDTVRRQVPGASLTPTLLPLVAALGHASLRGAAGSLPVLEVDSLAVSTARWASRAESLFVVTDSATFDAGRGWRTAHSDTVRAWHLVAGGLDAWVDEHGQVVHRTLAGNRSLHRTAYEIAFENWRAASPLRRSVAARSDVDGRTALEANVARAEALAPTLRYVLSGTELHAFALDGGWQHRHADTVDVTRPLVRDLPDRPAPPMGERDQTGGADREAPEVRTLAWRLAAPTHDPLATTRRLARWVHDSVSVDAGAPPASAREVLGHRRGDAEGIARLFVALSRAAGVPARPATGLLYHQGKFYYHAWPEVWLGEWTGVDPTLGSGFVSANYLRLLTNGAGARYELLRAIDRLQIDVLR